MIKRGKFYLPPSKVEGDFKEVFRHLTAAGVGRPVDEEGAPDRPWTADLMADAITQIDPRGSGVELRTIQLWFQDNDKGISPENIRWLARIFGCGDPEATTEWQVALSASQARLVSKRRQRRRSSKHEDVDPLTQSTAFDDAEDATATQPSRRRKQGFSLPHVTEAMFCGSALNLPASIFAGAVALGFLSYFLGVHNVTYSSPDAQAKQIGFLWAPNWTLLFMILMPLFFAVASDLLVFWKTAGRVALATHDDPPDAEGWNRHLAASSYSFWAIFLICIVFAGILQWIGVRLLPLLGTDGGYALDWGSVTLARPDVISVPVAIAFSGLAYLYMCLSFYLFFAALIFLYTIAYDFSRLIAASGFQVEPGTDRPQLAGELGGRIIRAIFRCTVLGIMVAMCMKLQSSYLTSNAANILVWFFGDAASVFGRNSASVDVADYTAPNHFSSLIIVLATVFVFLYTAFRSGIAGRFPGPVGMMVAAIVLLVVSYLSIGAFAGFSILLVTGVLVAIFGLYDPWFRRKQLDALEDQHVS